MSLLEKIRNHSAVVGVVGLGYVGLPLAVLQAKTGFRVYGIDEVAGRWSGSTAVKTTSLTWRTRISVMS